MITGIGDNCIDRYLAPIQADFVGGNVANVVANLALHGERAAYVGAIGDDAEGARIARALAEIGVDLRWLQRIPGGITGVTEIEVSGGDAHIIRERYGVSSSVNLSEAMLDRIATESTWLHTSETGDAARHADALRLRGARFSVDIGVIRSAERLRPLAALLSKCDIVFFSAGSQLDTAEVEDLARAIQSHGPATVVGTRGPAGCLAVDEDTLLIQSPEKDGRPIVDPLGAGDAFIAGFLATSGAALAMRVREGSRWAAETCRMYGCWPQ